MGHKRVTIITVTCALAIALVSFGCASSADRQSGERVWNQVGPDDAGSHAESTGRLVVYTAPDVHANWNDGMYVPHYSDYQVRSQEDVVLKKVHNGTGGVANRPAEVELDPGDYRVHARAVGRGWVLVPVIIKAGRVTTVRLDEYEPRHRDAAPAGN